MSEHKYDCKSGYPSFWNHIVDSVDYRKDFMDRYKTDKFNNAVIEWRHR